MKVLHGLFSIIAICFAVSVFTVGCKDYSTSDLLSLKFPTGGTKGLKITSPSPITVGQPFTVTVTATNTAMPQGIQQDYQNKINLTLQVGGGTLTSVTGGGWYLGTQNSTVVYNNPALSLNSTEVILLNGRDPLDASRNAVSNNITATSQVVFNQFKVVAPGTTFKGQPFNLTVTATNSDNTTNTAYNGTVNLSTYLVAGTVTPSSVTGFVNGVATVSVTLSQSYTSLQIQAVDSVTSTLTGLSNSFQVYFDTVAFVAFPQTATSIRSEWHYPSGTTQALVYRDAGSGFQLLQTVFSPTTYYTDLTAATGVPYTYKVVAQDVSATTQYTATMAATAPATPCTTTISAGNANNVISSDTTWNAAGSPYCIASNVTVNNPATLTITAGAVLLVSSGISVTVASGGKLVSQGTNTAPVTMTSANISPTAGDWKGVTFASGSVASGIASDNYTGSGSLLQYTVIEYAGPALSTVVSLYLDNVTIQNNRNTTSHGGGIYANLPAGQQLVIKNGLITNNALSGTTVFGGGIYSTQRVALYSSIVSGNQITGSGSGSGGAGLYLAGDNHLINSSQVQSNTFTSGSGSLGGGIALVGNTNTIVGSTIKSNTVATSLSAVGGGIYMSGSGSTLNNNFISANITQGTNGSSGGGIYVAGVNHTISKNTVSGNSTAQASLGGGVYFAVMTGNALSNNSITLNYANWGPGATLAPAAAGVYLATAAGVLTAQHNNIHLNTIAPGNTRCDSSATHDFSNSYWGGPTSGAESMGIMDSTNATHPGAGIISITGAVSTAWPLCKTAPSDPNCVGANF